MAPNEVLTVRHFLELRLILKQAARLHIRSVMEGNSTTGGYPEPKSKLAQQRTQPPPGVTYPFG